MSVTAERVSEDDRPRTTKNVFIYKAGDHNWPGIRVPLNKRRHRSIDAVLDELTHYLATEKTTLRAMPKTDYERILENQRYNANFRGSMRCWHTSKKKSDSSQSLPITRPARLPKLEVSVKRNKSSDITAQMNSSLLPPLNHNKLVSNQQRSAEAPKILSRREMLHTSDEYASTEEDDKELDRQNEAATKIQRFYRNRLAKNSEEEREPKDRQKRPY
ncbi:hypothetical protein QR680_002328 [Steinernema hermaphroditum]|uniref:Doublecortin domain-containing protein n=1 Tax=Steinernema hermaphroditum TaxID=289476 RepID=A0AA39H296_9BILA|nr:hypothetical protein QR680_002328 [Steinernema hermaphroditum]